MREKTGNITREWVHAEYEAVMFDVTFGGEKVHCTKCQESGIINMVNYVH